MSQRKRRSNETQAGQNRNHGSKPTPTSITSRETETFALRGSGEPLTARERNHVRKVIMFPFIGDTKAVCVRPRVSEREVADARRLTHRPTPARRRCAEVRAVRYFEQQVAA